MKNNSLDREHVVSHRLKTFSTKRLHSFADGASVVSYASQEINSNCQHTFAHNTCATSSAHHKANTKCRETFADRVYAALRALPAGSVTTYGQLAKIAGSAGAARAVGNILHNNPDPIYTPCFRVVNSAGRLAQNFGFGGIKQQRKMLMDDGILVKNYNVDLSKYQITDEE